MRISFNAVWGSDLQTTVSKPIIFEGIGLHKGLWSKLAVLPASIDSGICFKRVDVKVLGLVENMSYFICSNCNEKHEIVKLDSFLKKNASVFL